MAIKMAIGWALEKVTSGAAQKVASALGNLGIESTNRICAVANRTIDKTFDFIRESRSLERILERADSIGREICYFGGACTIAAIIIVGKNSICEDGKDVACQATRYAAATAIVVAAVLLTNMLASRAIQASTHSIESFRRWLPKILRPCSLGIPSNLPAPDATCTPLMHAAYHGRCEEICLLQQQGVFLEELDLAGRTAIHWAAIGKQQKALEWLWYFGCDLNSPATDTRYPLNYIQKDTPLHTLCVKLIGLKNRFALEWPIFLFYPPENLVFKGGGAKGIAFVGIQESLYNLGLLKQVKRIVGTSAGAITAMLVGLGYNSQELKDILDGTKLTDFLDHAYQSEQALLAAVAEIVPKGEAITIQDLCAIAHRATSWWHSRGQNHECSARTVLSDAYQKGGLCEGENFLRWIEDKIEKKTHINNCTFGEYKKQCGSGQPFKHVYFYATRINQEQLVCINSEDSQWDDVIMSHAIRASMSIPFVFKPHVLWIKTPEEIRVAPELGTFMDGGVIRNFALDRFDSKKYRATNPSSDSRITNGQTLALNFIEPPAAPRDRADGATILDAGAALMSIYHNAEDLLLEEYSINQGRIINIVNDARVGLISGFFATPATKQALIASATSAAERFNQRQRALAVEYAEHDPAKILSIFASQRQGADENQEHAPAAAPVLVPPVPPLIRRRAYGADFDRARAEAKMAEVKELFINMNQED